MNMKKILAMVLCVAMVLSVMSFTVSADTDFVAKIGETEYTDFDAALTDAIAATGNVEVEIYEKVTLNRSFGGNYDLIKFVGKDESAEIYLDVQGYVSATGKNVVFENLKLSKVAGGYVANAGFMNLAFGIFEAASVSYNNCTFLNGAYASKGVATFTNCTFYRSHDRYGLWAYGEVDCTVDGCTFADIRGIKMYDEGKSKVTNLTVTNTDFSAVDNKPAIVLTYGESVTLAGNTYSETGVFELDLDGAPNGTTVTSDVPPTCINDNGACGVIVDNKIYTTVAESAAVATSGSEVTLLYDTTENVTFDKGVILNVNGCTAPNVKVTTPVAEVNGVEYYSLNDAFAAVNDGDVINVLSNVVINKDTRAHNSGSWYDGVYYIGDKSFTVNLNGYTITHDGSVNDYLLNFKNDGAKANEITLMNGTIDAGTSAYCAICTSSTSTQQLTINLEDVEIINNISNGSVAKIRGGAVLNVKDGAIVTGKNSYLGIECVASTVNIYDGAEIYMNGTSSYNGCLVGACGNGVVNVYGGYGKGVKGGFIAMTSGGTINVYGGEWIANTDGSLGDNSNLYVLTAQNNKYESGYAGPSIINVYGGTLLGGMDAWNLHGTSLGEASELSISGGTFNVDPSHYVVDEFFVENVNGSFIATTKAASAINVVLKATSNPNVYDIVLESADSYDIYEFVSAELTFANASTTVGNNNSTMQYSISGIAGKTFAQRAADADKKDQFIFSILEDGTRLSGKNFVIGQVTFAGQGIVNFEVVGGKVATTKQNTHLGKYYTTEVGDETLKIDLAKIEDGAINEVKRNVAVNIAFNHNIVADYWNNNMITVTIKDGFGNVDTKDVAITNNAGICTFSDVKLGRLTVTVEGKGFRKYVYETTLEDGNGEFVLNFWNDVKRVSAEVIETGKFTMFHNFLVGDIVMDYIVDEYDLAAVTSYYGTYDIDKADASKYIKYDLNRDGSIDIIDVQYVLHTLNN